jgi:NADPH2:quinone reductase
MEQERAPGLPLSHQPIDERERPAFQREPVRITRLALCRRPDDHGALKVNPLVPRACQLRRNLGGQPEVDENLPDDDGVFDGSQGRQSNYAAAAAAGPTYGRGTGCSLSAQMTELVPVLVPVEGRSGENSVEGGRSRNLKQLRWRPRVSEIHAETDRRGSGASRPLASTRRVDASSVMPHAIRIHATGGPDVLRWESVDIGDPGPGQARVRHVAIGLNYIDTYHRSGLYPIPLPSGIGVEAAGVVEAVGRDVTEVAQGDRVAYCGGFPGAYAEVRLMPAALLVRLPEGVSERVAAALMLKGLTVQYLFRQTRRLERGETILFHAAAGGVGLIACQWARALGVTMIGTVGSDDKAALARAHGCAHTIVYTRESFVDRVREITRGEGVPVVYDGVGKETFPASLDCLAPRGMFVSFGNASGPVPTFDLSLLAAKGSLYAARPTLVTYTRRREDLVAMADELFALVRAGAIVSEPGQTYSLGDAARAHRDLESRKTTGSTLLLP